MNPTGRFTGLVAGVTGSARGIGRNIARALGREGARVVLCDIDAQNGSAAESDLRQEGVAAEFLRVDLGQKGAPQAMIGEIVRRCGRIDILVNNARAKRRTTLFSEDEESWDAGMAVNLKAAFFASQEAMRLMSQSGGGNIVNISSIAATLACQESPAYHISKAGLVQMTRYLAAHAPAGIRVNAVLPGFVVQDEHRARYEGDENLAYRRTVEFCHPMGRAGSSEDVANAVLFLCSPASSFISGQCLVVDGGLTLHEPSDLLLRFSNTTDSATKGG